MAQTPQQRRANEAFAKKAEKNHGKPEDLRRTVAKKIEKSPISKTWIILLGFVVIGGIFFELASLIVKAFR